MNFLKKKSNLNKIIHSESGFFQKPKKITKAEYILLIIGTVQIALYFIILNFAKSNVEFIEKYFSLSFYPVYIKFHRAVNSLLPLSVAEIILILFGIFILLFVITFICQLKKYCRYPLGVFARYTIVAVFVAGSTLTLYTFGCMPNYYRYGFVDYLDITPEPSHVSDLERLCNKLVADANFQRAGLTQTENGVFTYAPYTNTEIFKQAQESYTSWLTENPQWEHLFTMSATTTAKSVFFSEALSYAQLTGFYFPYTGEANINVHTSQMDIPATTAHELAHVSGFMREDEANYIAYLVCQASEYTHFNYSGTILALIHASNALYGQDSTAHSNVMANISTNVRTDLNADSAYYQAHYTDFGKFSRSVNDTFLKASDQSDGIKSYGRMVDLLMADFLKEN